MGKPDFLQSFRTEHPVNPNSTIISPVVERQIFPFGHLAGMDNYGELDLTLVELDYGALQFLKEYNTQGFVRFDDLIARRLQDPNLPTTEFQVSVGGLGYTNSFGTENRAIGLWLGDIGQQTFPEHPKLPGADVRIFSLVHAETINATPRTVAVYRDIRRANPRVSSKPYLHDEWFRADIRPLPSRYKATILCVPQNRGSVPTGYRM